MDYSLFQHAPTYDNDGKLKHASPIIIVLDGPGWMYSCFSACADRGKPLEFEANLGYNQSF